MTTEAGNGPLGILAAGGPLPLEIAAAARRAGRGVHIVALRDIAQRVPDDIPHTWCSVGQFGAILGALHGAGCREMVIAGAMQRPDLLRVRLDLGFIRRLPTVLAITRGGDDSVLRRVIGMLEADGLTVCGVGDVAPGLLAQAGPFGQCRPEGAARQAIARAQRLIEALGPFDVGQAAVATGEGIIAVEGVRGTDAMLRELVPGGAGAGLGAGGVLVKLAKPGQDMRIDLPTIGRVTVAGAAEAGLAGIAIGAGAAIVMDRAQVRDAADAAGLFVEGLPATPRERAPPAASVIPAEATAPLAVLGRRAPTPSDRRDIALARRLLPVLREHAAGPAAVIAGEHVLAIPGALPIGPLIRPLGARRHWGLRSLRGRIGTLVLDLASAAPVALDLEMFRAVQDARLAGIACLGAPLTGASRADAIGWADEARIFLMGVTA